MPTRQDIINEVKAHLDTGKPLTSEEEEHRLSISYSYALDFFTMYVVSGKDEVKLDNGQAIMKPNLLLNFVERISRIRLVNEQIAAAKRINASEKAQTNNVLELWLRSGAQPNQPEVRN